jgi:hypothetical protein
MRYSGGTNIYEAVMTGITLASPSCAPFVPPRTHCDSYPVTCGKCHDVAWDEAACGYCPWRKEDMRGTLCFERGAYESEAKAQPGGYEASQQAPPDSGHGFFVALGWLSAVTAVLMLAVITTSCLICCLQKSEPAYQQAGYEMQAISDNAVVSGTNFGPAQEQEQQAQQAQQAQVASAPPFGADSSAPPATAPPATAPPATAPPDSSGSDADREEVVQVAVYRSAPLPALHSPQPAVLGYPHSVPIATAVPVAQDSAPWPTAVPHAHSIAPLYTPPPASSVPVSRWVRTVAWVQMVAAVLGLFFGECVCV